MRVRLIRFPELLRGLVAAYAYCSTARQSAHDSGKCESLTWVYTWIRKQNWKVSVDRIKRRISFSREKSYSILNFILDPRSSAEVFGELSTFLY